MRKLNILTTLMFCTLSMVGGSVAAQPTLSALIIDGQNNHFIWAKSTVMMKRYLEETKLFEVDVYRTKPTWRGKKHADYYAMHSGEAQYDLSKSEHDKTFSPNFSDYDVVISNFGWRVAEWPAATKHAFEQYMNNGGGFVSVHAADNSFGNWLEYNKMIGVGGWDGRTEKNGPHLYYNDSGKLVRDKSKGKAGSHGKPFQLTMDKRNEHPIMAGLPAVWMHTKDECYGKLRGPAENMTILATAECRKGKHEPMLMVIDYGKGRIFHTTLGHDELATSSVGFITTLQRGAQWAATGKVTQAIPDDFPTAKKSSARQFKK